MTIEQPNRAQITDLLKSLETKDSMSVVDEMAKQRQLKTEEVTKMYQRQIDEVRSIQTEKTNTTIKQYNWILMRTMEPTGIGTEGRQMSRLHDRELLHWRTVPNALLCGTA
jgi:hypothetical protein